MISPSRAVASMLSAPLVLPGFSIRIDRLMGAPVSSSTSPSRPSSALGCLPDSSGSSSSSKTASSA